MKMTNLRGAEQHGKDGNCFIVVILIIALLVVILMVVGYLGSSKEGGQHLGTPLESGSGYQKFDAISSKVMQQENPADAAQIMEKYAATIQPTRAVLYLAAADSVKKGAPVDESLANLGTRLEEALGSAEARTALAGHLSGKIEFLKGEEGRISELMRGQSTRTMDSYQELLNQSRDLVGQLEKTIAQIQLHEQILEQDRAQIRELSLFVSNSTPIIGKEATAAKLASELGNAAPRPPPEQE